MERHSKHRFGFQYLNKSVEKPLGFPVEGLQACKNSYHVINQRPKGSGQENLKALLPVSASVNCYAKKTST